MGKIRSTSFSRLLDYESCPYKAYLKIVEKIPELSQMIALRESLKALKGPLGNIPDFRKQVQALVKDEGVRERLLNELGIQNK